MRKRKNRLKLNSETLRTLAGKDLPGVNGGDESFGLDCQDHDDTGGGGGGGGIITFSVPFCPSFYPNPCSMGCS